MKIQPNSQTFWLTCHLNGQKTIWEISRIEQLPWRKKVFSRFPAHKDKSKIYLEKIKVEISLLNWSLLYLIRWDPGWAKNRHTGHQMLFGGRRRYRQVGQCFHLRKFPAMQQSFHLSHHQLKLIPLPPLQSPPPSTHPKRAGSAFSQLFWRVSVKVTIW